MSKNLVYSIPDIVAEESEGDFSFELNDIGELRISNKYEPTTFVLSELAMEKLRQIIPIPLFQLHHQSKKGWQNGICCSIGNKKSKGNVGLVGRCGEKSFVTRRYSMVSL